MRLCSFLIIILTVTCITASGDSTRKGLPFPANWIGTTALRSGDYSGALQQILMDSVPGDTVLRDFKLAVLYHQLKSYSTALSFFLKVIERNPDLSPAVYVYIAEIERELGRPGNSLAAYRSVLRGNIPQRFRTYIFKNIQSILAADTTLGIENAPWLEEYYRWLPTFSDVAVPDSVMDSLQVFLAAGNMRRADSLLTIELHAGTVSHRFILFSEKIQGLEKLSAANIYRLGRIAHSCGRLDFSQALYDMIREKKGLFSIIPEKEFTKFYAELMFDKQKWHEAIKWHKKYVSRFGKDPDAFFSIARAYRKIDKNNDAAQWYDRLLAEYPRHPKTEEILWLRAWQYEDKKQYSKAGTYYRKIYSAYRKGARTDESYLRHGLCYYRENKFDSAIAILQKFEDLLPQSSLVNAEKFWQAKSYLAKGKKDDALSLLRLVSYKEPFDYYAHRSRQILLELKDTSSVIIDTIRSENQIIFWLDSLSMLSESKKILSGSDSTALICGCFLAIAGDIEKADFFIEPVELQCPGNLTLQYHLVNFFTSVGASAQAYRVARRLTWRIPQECRSELPLALYRFFYPTFYSDFIELEASRYNVHPSLVSGIIRQESIFNPQITSPAGAVGLMQIMPATGKVLGQKTGTAFSVDSLYKPHYNIRFGIYYINELLSEFDGNTMLALAGYNAGPHNAMKWKKENGGKELDLFVEDIGFSETRGYVKKVMANYWTYGLLQKYPAFEYGKKTSQQTYSHIKTSDNSNQ